MLPRNSIAAFEQIKLLLDVEGEHLADPDRLGMLEGIGIAINRQFNPDDSTRGILDAAAKTAYKTSRVIGLADGANDLNYRVYADRKWLNPVNDMKSRWLKSATDVAFLFGFSRIIIQSVWFR
jgi:hypothetical protein